MIEFIETLQGLNDSTQFVVLLLCILGLILINMFFSMVKTFFVEFFKIFRKTEKCECKKDKKGNQEPEMIKS